LDATAAMIAISIKGTIRPADEEEAASSTTIVGSMYGSE
jgi:hypothetical protein